MALTPGEPSDRDFFADAIGGLGGKEPDDTITVLPDRGGGGDRDDERGGRVDERGFRHDERGRFDGRADQGGQQGGEDEGGEGQDTGGIPSWRVRELNAERREAIARADTLARENEDFKRRLATIEANERARTERQQPPMRPDPLRDPEGFFGHLDERFGTVEERIAEAVDRREVNRTFAEAHEQFGTEFEQAYLAARESVAEGNTQLFEDFKAAYNPGKALMQWWKREKGYREVGDDLDAYNERQRENLLKDENFREKALEAWGFTGGQGGQMQRRDSRNDSRERDRTSTVIQLPSVNQASGSGGNGRDGNRPGALPVTDRDFFNDAVGGLPMARAQRARRGA
jgi:hypothetical protein